MATLTIHVLDEDQNPVSGEHVYCNYSATLGSGSNTDRNGIAEFDSVPVGTVEVLVGQERVEVIVWNADDHKDVTVTI